MSERFHSWEHRQPKLTSRESEGLIISGVWDGTWPFDESGIGLRGGCLQNEDRRPKTEGRRPKTEDELPENEDLTLA